LFKKKKNLKYSKLNIIKKKKETTNNDDEETKDDIEPENNSLNQNSE